MDEQMIPILKELFSAWDDQEGDPEISVRVQEALAELRALLEKLGHLQPKEPW